MKRSTGIRFAIDLFVVAALSFFVGWNIEAGRLAHAIACLLLIAPWFAYQHHVVAAVVDQLLDMAVAVVMDDREERQ